MRTIGAELHRFLAERGMSLRAVAREAGCSAGYLSNVTHGRKVLTPSVAARLDKALGTGGTFAAFALNAGQLRNDARRTGLSPDQRESGRRGPGPRSPVAASERGDSPPATWAATITEAKRDAIRLWGHDLDLCGTPPGGAAMVPAIALSWLTAPSENTSSLAPREAEVSWHDVSRLREVRARLKDLDNAHGGAIAFPMAVAYLRDEATALLRGSCDEATGRALLTAIAEAELDAGWFAYDAGDHQLARLYMIHALRLAHAGGSRLLGARVVCAMSHQALHVGQVGLSVDLARAARAGAGADATPRGIAMLAAMEAMANAGAHDLAGCQRALSEAEHALALAAPDDGDPDWLDFDEGGLLGHSARAHRDLAAAGLSSSDHAMRSALRSAEQCRAGHRRTRAQRYAILATACLQAGEIEEAAAAGELVVADAWDTRSRHVQDDVAALLASIEPARSSAAREFAGQAREFLATRARSQLRGRLSRS